jgi:hypothetical protein
MDSLYDILFWRRLPLALTSFWTGRSDHWSDHGFSHGQIAKEHTQAEVLIREPLYPMYCFTFRVCGFLNYIML